MLSEPWLVWGNPELVFREYQRSQHELERLPVEFLGRWHNELMRSSRAALARYFATDPDNLVYTQNVTICCWLAKSPAWLAFFMSERSARAHAVGKSAQNPLQRVCVAEEDLAQDVMGASIRHAAQVVPAMVQVDVGDASAPDVGGGWWQHGNVCCGKWGAIMEFGRQGRNSRAGFESCFIHMWV